MSLGLLEATTSGIQDTLLDCLLPKPAIVKTARAEARTQEPGVVPWLRGCILEDVVCTVGISGSRQTRDSKWMKPIKTLAQAALALRFHEEPEGKLRPLEEQFQAGMLARACNLSP